MANKQKEYTFVLDCNGKQLDPTTIQNAWILIRKNKAKLVSKYPMTIQLNKEILDENKDEIRCGIDDGGLHVGVALIQKCKTKNKVLFKGTIEQRDDVKKLMEQRRGYRRYKRSHKRYRQARFDNRSSSKRKERIAPSILQKRQATLRVIEQLNKVIKINSYYLEDVSINIRAMTDGFKSYSWQYNKSNRLDENLRKATILRDGCKCMECGKLYLTNGGDTANKRIDWNIKKSHCNDAMCITDLIPDTCVVKEWTMKPMRRQNNIKKKADEILGFKHRDLVSYTYRNGETFIGYVTALYPLQHALNFQSKTKHCKKVNAEKCKLLWRYNKIYWLECV